MLAYLIFLIMISNVLLSALLAFRSILSAREDIKMRHCPKPFTLSRYRAAFMGCTIG